MIAAKLQAWVENDDLTIWVAFMIGFTVAVVLVFAGAFFFLKVEDIRYDLKAARKSGHVPFHLLVGGLFVGSAENSQAYGGLQSSDGGDGFGAGSAGGGDGGGGD